MARGHSAGPGACAVRRDSTGGGDLRWIDFARDGATLALEFDAKGLSCVQLYADGYA
ncbi:MAG TPA: hypothetical protein VMN03_01645 [Burkholderiales bacterium]|nr:hypothetical protein [Burkholderiales bacterium]